MSEDQVTRLLKSAIAAVDASGVSADLREEAFKSAVALLAASVAPKTPGPASRLGSGTGGAGDLPEELDPNDPLDAVAAFLGCDPAGVHRIFAVQDGIPELKIKSTKLPGPKGTAAVDIALLVMAARQGAGIEEYTAIKELQTVQKTYAKFDANNNAGSMKKLDHLVLKKGNGVNLERKLTRPGIEEAAAKVAEYATEKA